LVGSTRKSCSPSWQQSSEVADYHAAMSLAAMVKKHRLAAGLTQEELAEKALVSARTISDVERGVRSRIYRDTAERLARALALDESDRAGLVAASRARSAAGTPHAGALPLAPSRLVGRSRELTNLISLLEARALRLITLTGPGGVGKTRLAIEAARRTDGDAVFVDLGDLTDPRLVVPAIARAVGVPGRSKPTTENIAEHVGGAALLIVIDTFEHVLSAAPEIAQLIAFAPKIAVLATSREALRVRGEHQIVVPPLDLGAAGTAVALFIERASAASLSSEMDVEIAADICRRLGGLPLGIELAAARTKHLPLSALRDQLGSALEVLTHGARDLPRRQRTMRDTIRWSYALLRPSEQRTLCELCVFAGGWTLEEAALVCSSDALVAGSALLDKSLIGREDDRYWMLDVIKEFGLDIGPPPGAYGRHLDAFVALAERAEPELGGTEQDTWVERLAREQGNIRAAIAYAIGTKDGERAMRLSAGVWRYWMLHGDLSEGRAALREALMLELPTRLRSKGLWGLAWLAYHQGDYEEAESCSATMLEIASDDAVERRNALTVRGIIEMAKGDPQAAIPTLESCVELLRGRDPDWLSATSLLNLGMAMLHARDQRAAETLARARDLYERIGDDHFVARATLYGGYDALLRGHVDAATRCARRAVISFWQLDDRWGAVEGLELAAAVAAAGGRGEVAATLSGVAGVVRAAVTSAPFPLDAAVLRTFLARVRLSGDDREWAMWQARGRQMRLEEAVEIVSADRWERTLRTIVGSDASRALRDRADRASGSAETGA
jgi:predicted ATPase/DNA-binding XRE family transcriptional regulator